MEDLIYNSPNYDFIMINVPLVNNVKDEDEDDEWHLCDNDECENELDSSIVLIWTGCDVHQYCKDCLYREQDLNTYKIF